MNIEFSSNATRVLYDGRIGRLATADRSGQPLVVPICYAFDGRHCYSAIDLKPKRATSHLKRLGNIRENPHVSLLIDHYEEEWSRLHYVIIQARAEILSEGREFSEAVGLLVSKYPQYHTMPLDREAGTMIKISPHRVIEWRADGMKSGKPA
jgi:PPOX class probable F420-dependent enzyme